jgi:hypothetical protein
MSTQDDFRDAPAPKQGMSSTSKVLLILGSIAGVCLLACCGGGIFLYIKAKDAIQNFAQNFTTSDPEEIRQRTAEIMHIDIPEEFPPLRAFNLFVMKQILYGKEGSGSMVMIMEINQQMQGGQGGANMKQQREQMLRQMRQQQQQQGQGAGNMDTDITEESSETREFTINGEKVPFEFIKGRSPNGGTPVRQVVGMFAGESGTIMLMVMVPESEYHEDAIVKMIESIRLPDDSQDSMDATDSMDSHDATTPEKQPAGDEPGGDEEPAQRETESSPESSP